MMLQAKLFQGFSTSVEVSLNRWLREEKPDVKFVVQSNAMEQIGDRYHPNEFSFIQLTIFYTVKEKRTKARAKSRVKSKKKRKKQ
jgi:hypothetical protein